MSSSSSSLSIDDVSFCCMDDIIRVKSYKGKWGSYDRLDDMIKIVCYSLVSYYHFDKCLGDYIREALEQHKTDSGFMDALSYPLSATHLNMTVITKINIRYLPVLGTVGDNVKCLTSLLGVNGCEDEYSLSNVFQKIWNYIEPSIKTFDKDISVSPISLQNIWIHAYENGQNCLALRISVKKSTLKWCMEHNDKGGHLIYLVRPSCSKEISNDLKSDVFGLKDTVKTEKPSLDMYLTTTPSILIEIIMSSYNLPSFLSDAKKPIYYFSPDNTVFLIDGLLMQCTSDGRLSLSLKVHSAVSSLCVSLSNEVVVSASTILCSFQNKVVCHIGQNTYQIFGWLRKCPTPPKKACID